MVSLDLMERWQPAPDINTAGIDQAVDYVVTTFNSQVTMRHEPAGGAYTPAVVDPGLFSSHAIATRIRDRLTDRMFGAAAIVTPEHLEEVGIPNAAGTILVAADRPMSAARHERIFEQLAHLGLPTAIIAPRAELE